MFVSGTFSRTEDFEHDLSTRDKRADDYNRELYGKLGFKDKFEISGRLSSYRDHYSIKDHLRECSEQKSFSFVQAGYNDSFKKRVFPHGCGSSILTALTIMILPAMSRQTGSMAVI